MRRMDVPKFLISGKRLHKSYIPAGLHEERSGFQTLFAETAPRSQFLFEVERYELYQFAFKVVPMNDKRKCELPPNLAIAGPFRSGAAVARTTPAQ